MKPTMCLSGMILSSFRWSTRCHAVSYAAVKSRNTPPDFLRCAGSCLRCLVLVVLPGPRLIYHGGNRLVPEEAVGPPQGRCGCAECKHSYNTPSFSRTLNGTQSSETGLFDSASFAGLFGFGRATTVVRRQVFGSLNLRKHDVKNEHRHACSCLCALVMTNSRWMLSRPGALPYFNFLMAASSYSTVKSHDWLASAVAALES